MTNRLVRLGTTYSTPAVPAALAQPAYTSYATETVTTPTLYSNAPAGWAYRQVTDIDGKQSIQLVYLGTLPSGGGVSTTTPPQYASTTLAVPTFHPATEATPGTPAVRVDNPPLGWTSFAHSGANVFGTGYIDWKAPANAAGAVVGLSATPAPLFGYTHIDHGLLLSAGTVRNLRTGASYGTYVSADVFRMRVASRTITFLKNDVSIGSEDNTYAKQTMFMSAALYGAGDFVDAPVLAAEYYGGSDGVLPALDVFSSDRTMAQSVGVLSALYGISGVLNRADAVLPALAGFSADRAVYAQAIGALPALVGMSYGGTLAVIKNNYAETQLSALIGAGLMLTGEIGGAATVLPALYGMSSDRPYAYSQGVMPALQGISFWLPEGEAFLTELAGGSPTLAATAELLVLMFDGVAAASTMTGGVVLDEFLQSGASVHDTWATSAILDAVMMAIANAGDAVVGVPSTAVVNDTWVFNPDSGGSTTYSNYGFNSFMALGGKHYGANENGLFELDGETDAGAPIRSRVSFGKLNFGTATKKTVSEAYVGFSGAGNLFVKVIAEGAAYIYKTRDFSAELQQQRVTFGKGLRTNYVWLELYNEGGKDFELDTVEFHVADLTPEDLIMATYVGTIAPDITDGGGAPAVTVDVINAMWKNAQSKSDAGAANVDTAVGYAGPAPTLNTPVLDTTYVPPLSPTLTDTTPADGEAMYATARDQMLAMITTNFASFIATYFPNPAYYTDALTWCHTVFTAGGSGIDTDVEAQLWERGRARILGDSERVEAEATATWANRRWPVPPGALTSQVNQIRLDAGRKLAEQSRDISVKSFDAELENVKFAVKEVLDQRKITLDAAGNYIRTLMLGPQTAMQLATGLANIRSEFSRNLVQLYSAQSVALEPRVRLAIADADLKMRGETENLRSQLNTIDNKVRAALQGAQLVASMASAGINAISGRASISGNDSSSL